MREPIARTLKRTLSSALVKLGGVQRARRAQNALEIAHVYFADVFAEHAIGSMYFRVLCAGVSLSRATVQREDR